jgi:hypothetical protein
MEDSMHQRVSFADFVDSFRAHRREGQFSYEALRALFHYLEDLEEDTGTPVELDVVGLCCDFQEATADEVIRDYNLDASGAESEHDRYMLAKEFLEDQTTVVWDNGNRFLFHVF